MEAGEIQHIEPKDYIFQSDDKLKEIISNHAHTVVGDIRGQQFELAYRLLHLRTTERLVSETSKLVEKTCNLAEWTMVVGIGTIVVAFGIIATFLFIYLSKGH